MLSLSAMGIPWSGPRWYPARIIRSAAWATSRACWSHTVMYALSCLLTAAIRWSTASVSSTGDSSRRVILGAASAIVRFSRSAWVMADLLSLGKPRDRHDASAPGHLAVELVRGRDQHRQHRHQLLPPGRGQGQI